MLVRCGTKRLWSWETGWSCEMGEAATCMRSRQIRSTHLKTEVTTMVQPLHMWGLIHYWVVLHMCKLARTDLQQVESYLLHSGGYDGVEMIADLTQSSSLVPLFTVTEASAKRNFINETWQLPCKRKAAVWDTAIAAAETWEEGCKRAASKAQTVQAHLSF